jgi:hypothetical protein
LHAIDQTHSSKSGGKLITNSLPSSVIGWVAIATGITGLFGFVFIILFFSIGQPFGTLNDVCIGLAAILSGVLAWMVYPEFHTQSPFLSRLALIVVLAGTLIVVTGSILVVSGITGWYLAGLYMSVGNALIALWLFGLNYSALQDNTWPHRLVIFGLVTGVIMALGFLALPGIIQGIDSWDSAPWYINYIGQVGALGWLILYPTWCILIGRVLILK